MDKILLVFLLFSSNLRLFSQSELTLVNPIHNFSLIRDIEFVNDLDGVLVGNDNIYVTHDGGETWNIAVNSIGGYKIDGVNGFIAIISDNNTLLKSTDNGNDWSAIDLPTTYVYNLDVTADHTVYLLGQSTIYKSTNEGESWTENDLPQNGSFISLKIIESEIILVGTYQGEIYKSFDDGASWELVFEAPEMYQSISTIDFPNSQIGFASVGEDFIIRSIDGGDTWTPIDAFNEEINDIHFINASVGYACGQNSSVFKTTDGGENWTYFDLNFTTYTHFEAIHVFNEESVITVGSNRIFRTNDGGSEWNPYNCSYSDIMAFDVYNSNDIYLIDEVGAVKINIGANSCSMLADLNTNYNSTRDLEMLNGLLGYSIVEDGIVKRTEDGGFSWETVSFGSINTCGDFYDISFSDNVVLVSCGCAPSVLKSTDYGYTWEVAFGGYKGNFHFLTDSIVYLYPFGIGFSGHNIYKSVDKGDTFNVVSTFDDPIRSAYFASEMVGYAGIGHNLFKTIDGGNSWNQIPMPVGISSLSQVSNMIFLNENVGWICNFGTEVYETLDGGITWVERNTGNIFIREFEKYDQTLYVAGIYGYIFKKDFSSINSVTESRRIPEINVFPNPTSNTANIVLPNSFTTFKYNVYNVLGAEVNPAIISIAHNWFKVSFDNYPAGVYIIQIHSEYGIFSKKLIIR